MHLCAGLLTEILSKLNQLLSQAMSDENSIKLMQYGRAQLIESLKIIPTQLSPTSQAIENRTREQRRAENWKLSRDFMLDLIPSTISSVLGEECISEGMLTLHELLQCPLIVRSLLYSLLDICWLHFVSQEV